MGISLHRKVHTKCKSDFWERSHNANETNKNSRRKECTAKDKQRAKNCEEAREREGESKTNCTLCFAGTQLTYSLTQSLSHSVALSAALPLPLLSLSLSLR